MKLIASLFIIICSVHSVWAGITLNATRVIYNESQKEAAITISTSGENRPYLVQSWLENGERGETSPPFVITPPLFKLMPDTTWQIRITRIREGLANDRESLFWLNVKAIPASDNRERNRMLIATKNVMKLIWRPDSLNAAAAGDAVKQVSVLGDGKAITFRNPTPYFVNIGSLRVNGLPVNTPGYIAPFATHTIPHSQRHGQLEIQAINDYGGLTPAVTLNF
ncbi:fimbrial biogenesis chaperone [Enterobacter sp. UPMP2060]